MQSRQFKMYVIFTIMIVTFAKGYETNLMTAAKHKISKREDAAKKYQRDPSKSFGYAGRLYPVKTIPETEQNASGSIDVKTAEGRLRAAKNNSHRSFHGYLQLVPLNQHGRSSGFNSRHQKLVPRDGRSRMRYYHSRPRMQRSRVPGDSMGAASKSHSRFSSHRPPTYHNYPPFWPARSNRQKFGSFQRFQGPKAISHFPSGNAVAFLEKECNACNSVPWTPILKPSAAHDSFDTSPSRDVPTIEVHHDLHAYSSNREQTVSSAAQTATRAIDSTIPDSYGLPVGNIPTAHGLLPPINPAKAKTPQAILNAPPGSGYLQPIPFPELSPVPVAPLHNPNQFVQVGADTQDLVPPVPPQKSSSNVIFTISEQGPYQSGSYIKNHIGHAGSGQNPLALGEGDLHSEPSSLIDTRLLSHVHRFNRFNVNPNNHNLDIVKSVPVAEFTSSIEYPLHFIQSPQYIDITTYSNATNTESTAYEKEPQTGKHKISDILLGLVRDANSKKSPAASADVEPFRNVTPYGSGDGISLSLTKKSQSNDNSEDSYLSLFGVPYGNEQKSNFTINDKFSGDNSQSQTNLREDDKSIDADILNPPPVPPSFIWSDTRNPQIPGGNPISYFVDPSQHRQKSESAASAGGTFAETTSASWLVPAQSNEAPQWILPVSSSPAIPYPLFSEEGIASVVNGELSPKLPQPANNSKTKKVQIIIPYTTGENKDRDQQILETVESSVYKTTPSENSTLTSVAKPVSFNFSAANTGASGKRGEETSGKETFFGIAEFSAGGNNSHKYLNEVRHILALNIKELLKDEVEPPKSEQNIRLQKNIDDWTALEYSNHKTIAKKEPQDVISYANAVTSIPGTSISHLLLNSKKIPEKYLTTTPMPEFDEPETTQFVSGRVSVASKPFTTKAYDTSDLYSTVTRIIPTPAHKTNAKLGKNTNGDHRNKNHRHGYTEVKKIKANQWAKLTENLIVPENVSNKSVNSTAPSWSDKRPRSTSATNEDVYVVTPVSVWQSSSADEASRRTTRQALMTDRPTTSLASGSTESAKAHAPKLLWDKTQRTKISKFNKPKLIQKFFASTKPPPRNLTKIAIKTAEAEKNPRASPESVIELNETETRSINDIFPFRNGGELPLELTINANSTETNFRMSDKRKDVKNFNLTRSDNTKAERDSDKLITRESSTVNTSATIDSGTNEAFSRLQNTTRKGNNSNAVKPDPEMSANNTAFKSIREFESNSTGSSHGPEEVLPILPAGIYGETKKVRLASDNDSTSELSSLNDTIKLLKEYLKYDSDELPSEKTDATINLKEKDQS